MTIHKQLVKLYKLRQNLKLNKGNNWKSKAVNRVIKNKKNQLIVLLDKAVEDNKLRELNPETLNEKSVINLFSSELTRNLEVPLKELTEDLIIVRVYFFQVFNNLVHQGFMFKGEKYVFFTASAGQIRTKKAVFIKEKAYERVRLRLMCGLSVEDINKKGGMNANKFLSYLALTNSATDEWKDFDIDKSIVVDDFETVVTGLVDHISSDYTIKREVTEVTIPHMDGCGIMLDKPTRMVRLPWVKGLLVHFPYDKFLRQKCTQDQWVVTDIYGTKHNVILEDIRYIFSKSQFKLYKFFDSWETYKKLFKLYGCNASYCNIEEPFIPKAKINYQMLQTLTDIKDDELDKILKKTIDEIENIGNDYQTTMRLVGATEYNKNKSYMQEALMIYPELFRDTYSREILKQTKKSLVKHAKGGRLRVNGKYLFIAPDLYAFCEWLFKGEQNPKGLLANGEVYTNQFRDEDELACLRSPHLYREWAIRKNKRNKELDKWFGNTKCVYTSVFDMISKILQ